MEKYKTINIKYIWQRIQYHLMKRLQNLDPDPDPDPDPDQSL